MSLWFYITCTLSNNKYCSSTISKGFPGGAGGKEPDGQCKRCKRPGFHPWVGNIPREGDGNTLQYYGLRNSMDRGPWQAIVHGVTKSQT